VVAGDAGIQELAADAAVARIAGSEPATPLPPMFRARRHGVRRWPGHGALLYDPRVVARGGAGTFVGRTSELASLHDALDAALAGRGSLVMLVGEPGIGKTRLAEEIATRARDAGADVLWGRVWEGGGAPALWPWVQILRGWVADAEPERLRAAVGPGGALVAHVAPELLERLPDLVVPALPEGETGRFRLLDAVASTLRRAAQRRPLVLVLDDLHWADEASLELLALLARDVAGAPLLVVGTYRDTDVDRDDPRSRLLGRVAREGTSNPLRGFSAEDVRAFVAANEGVTPSPALVAAVLERTDGNPLFVSEVVRLLIADRVVDTSGTQARWMQQIPSGVQDVIRRRIERLPPDCAAVLRRGAVLGRDFDLRVVDRMRTAADSAPLDVIDAAISARLIVPITSIPGAFRFAHALVRDTLYADLTAVERAHLHHAAGVALETIHRADLEPHRGELAHHFFVAAANGDAERAMEHAEAAARRALALRAYDEAARLYELALGAIALGHADDGAPAVRRTEIQLALLDARSQASDDARTRDAYVEVGEVAARLGLTEALARAAFGAGGRGDMGGAPDPRLVALLERALAALGPKESTIRSRLLSRLSGALTLIPGTRHRRTELSDDAIAMAERTGDADTLAFALVARHLALCGPGGLADRLATSQRLLRVAEEAGSRESLAMALQWRSAALIEAGDVQAADQTMQRYAALTDELRQPAYRVHMAEWRAMRALLDGRFDDAEPLIAATLALGAHGDPMNRQMRYVTQMTMLRREQGRLEEMADAVFGVVDAMPAVPAFRAGAAMVAVETGREAEARAHFEVLAANDFADFPHDVAWAGGMAQLARVCAALSDVPRAAVLYDLLLPDAERNLVVGLADVCEGAAMHYLGMLAGVQGRFDEAVRHFEAALAANARMGARPALAHTQREYAAVCLRRDDRGRAGELLAAATATYQDLGMTTFAERARALTVAAAGAAPADGPARAGNVFVRQGDYWTVRYGDTVVRLRDGKGLRYLAELLRRPGTRTHVLDLATAVDGRPAAGDRQQARAATADERLSVGRPAAIADAPDARARREYRRRAEELHDELEEAERHHDVGRTSRLRAELELVGAELASAYGSGLARRTNDAVEKARKAVTNRIRSVLDHLKREHPALRRHLSASLKLGTWCVYEPSPDARWHFG
jgi:tetratricopeptide (TPR) repeat protein